MVWLTRLAAVLARVVVVVVTVVVVVAAVVPVVDSSSLETFRIATWPYVIPEVLTGKNWTENFSIL
jgi:hypothetical protein